jgi:hypothetical protein
MERMLVAIGTVKTILIWCQMEMRDRFLDNGRKVILAGENLAVGGGNCE